MAAKVLLVEDDNNLREIYEARLLAEGYTIATARDGEEALVVAKSELPNLIISDVMMPRISGFEMLDILRNTDTLRDTKVIMLTALGQSDDKTRANSLGADRYLVKSQVTLEDIVKAAHELLEGTPPAATPVAITPTNPITATASFAPSLPPTMDVSVASAPTASVGQPMDPVPTPTITPPSIPLPQPQAAPVDANLSGMSSPAYNPGVGAPVATAPTPIQQPVEPAMPAPLPSFQLQPAPEPIAPAPATTPPVDAQPAALSSAPQSTSDEQATVGAQIENFIQNLPAAPPPAPAEQHDAVLANAVQDLTNQAEEKPVEQQSADSTPPAPTSGSVAITNKKIIQPLHDAETRLDIHELLAREEAKEITSQTTAPAQVQAVPSPIAPTPPPVTGVSTPVQPVLTVAPMPAPAPDISSMPPATTIQPTMPASPTTPIPAPAPPSDFDPNSIAL